MEQFETRFSQVDVLPMVKHFMDELDLFNLFKRYMPATPDCLADHAESLCILTANINYIYVADCKRCSSKNLNLMAQNGDRFITIVPKYRKEVKRFLTYLKGNEVTRKDAFNIEKLPILAQGMKLKKPTWNNIRYFYRNVHYSQIIREGACVQAMVKGFSPNLPAFPPPTPGQAPSIYPGWVCRFPNHNR